jgi:hypothetical protein
MPASLGQAASQQRRWESGRLFLLRRYWRQLLRAALLRGDPSTAVALIDVAMPPLSIIVAGDVALIGLALFAGTPLQLAAALAVMAGITLYVGTGFYFARLPARALLSLIHAPQYVVWKLWLYAQQLPRRRELTWVRTSRDRRTHP